MTDEKHHRIPILLGILIFAMLILWPFLMMVGIRNTILDAVLNFPQLQDRYTYYYFRTAILWVVVISLAFSLIGGGLLFKRRKRTSIYWAILMLWLSGPVGVVASLTIPFFLYDLGNPIDNIHQSMATLVADCLVRACWTAYLLMSPRVKAVYPSREEGGLETLD